jgi:hypothetical protein
MQEIWLKILKVNSTKLFCSIGKSNFRLNSAASVLVRDYIYVSS